MATTNAAEIMTNLKDSYVYAGMFDALEDQIAHCVLLPFAQKFTVPVAIPTTGNEILRLFRFPAGAYIWEWRSTPSDMDTGGSPALTYSIITTDDADTTQLTIVSLSTNGRAAAGSDRILDAAVGRYVGSQWCCLKTGTAAQTPAAGTIKAAYQFSIGVINRSARGPYLRDAEA